MNETQSESLQKPVESAQPTGIARRRLLRAGLAAGPVVLALSGRSAMAGTCSKGLSPLAWNSLAPDGSNCNLTSHTVTTKNLGASPGNWKPNGNCKLTIAWPTTCVPYSGYPSTTNVPTDLASRRWATGTKFNQIFTGTPAYVEGASGIRAKSVSLILLDDNGTLEWHLCAAYLNAATGTGDVMTPPEVQEAYAGKVGSLSLNVTQMKAFLSQTWA